MKTKIKKDWYGREKSIEELHNDSRNWVSEINFITDEIRFLEHLLGANYLNCKEAGFSEKIKTITKKIIAEKKVGKAAKVVIKEQEKILSNLIKNKSAEANKNYLETHKKLEAEINYYIKKYKNIKRQIFDIIETINKRKEQVKLA